VGKRRRGGHLPLPILWHADRAEETDAIAQFVLGGGCLAIIADALQGEQGAVMGNKTLAAVDGESELSGKALRHGVGPQDRPVSRRAGHGSGILLCFPYGASFRRRRRAAHPGAASN
jgi:hypothetical protein